MAIKAELDNDSPFESLLHSREKALKKIAEQEKIKNANKAKDASEYTRADKGATLPDFFERVKHMVLNVRALKEERVEFYPDDSLRPEVDLSKKIDHPYIFYTLISRVPRDMNIKPRYREEIWDRNTNGTVAQQGAIYGQIFDCDVQFNIVATDYSQADRVMYAFEDAMLTYTGSFKKNGVSEIVFLRQFTDSNLDIYRQEMSVRSLVFRVSIERIRLAFDTTITSINQLS